jgi:enoyl-CoA hydratase
MSTVLYEKSGHIALVTINRPDARNAIDTDVGVGLAETWAQIRDDDDVRVAIVTGAGDKAFCAGADLAKLIPLVQGLREPETDADRKFLADGGMFDRAILRDFDVVKPVIAAVNGFAIAGGMELCHGTDMRIASETAKFGVQEVRWALFPMGGSTVRMPRQLPHARAMELLLTGDFISAEEAFALGYVNRVVPQDKVLDEAMTLAGKIARNGPLAVQAIRKSVRACLGQPEAEGLRIETEIASPIFHTEDAKEGPRAFLEKREPEFKGR